MPDGAFHMSALGVEVVGFPFQAFELGMASLFCVVWLVLFVIAILIAIWVYRDAESRGMSGVLWLIVVLIGGIIGLIIYLIVRKDKVAGYPGQPYQYQAQYQPPPAYQAPAQQPPPAQFCANCGSRLSPGARNCPNCGAPVR